MKVLKNNILIKETLDSEKNKTESGLIITATKDLREPVEATVEEVGADVKGVVKGDKILYMPKFGVIDFSFKGDSYKILREDEVLAVL